MAHELWPEREMLQDLLDFQVLQLGAFGEYYSSGSPYMSR